MASPSHRHDVEHQIRTESRLTRFGVESAVLCVESRGILMKRIAIFVGLVAVAVLATAALSGNAGVKQTAGEQARIASLQQQVNELRNELICLDTIAGNGVAADGYWAAEASGAPKTEPSVDDRGVCKKLGVVTQGTTPVPNAMIPPFKQLAHRAFGG